LDEKAQTKEKATSLRVVSLKTSPRQNGVDAGTKQKLPAQERQV